MPLFSEILREAILAAAFGTRNPENGESQHIEPAAGDRLACLGHQSLSLPGQPQPEPAVVGITPHQRNAADHLLGSDLEPQGPVPCLAPGDGGQGHVAAELQGAVRRIGPGHLGSQELDDLPVGEKFLGCHRVGKFERAQPKSRCLKHGRHCGNQE